MCLHVHVFCVKHFIIPNLFFPINLYIFVYQYISFVYQYISSSFCISVHQYISFVYQYISSSFWEQKPTDFRT